jgi:hypothetical protein
VLLAFSSGARLLERRLPEWPTLGVSPSGVNLLIGTVWCRIRV